ncbi:hypothetical protein V502_03401 [Pseudogymnoascus sp. VKM F-4520 (FW-2644)]|nr:hypothetical protein V502_03401 [Pseudogymnoascus sp. VKM F-4520 (FW-2644)]
MSVKTQEAKIIFVIEAIRIFKKLNPSTAAKIYKVPRSTLLHRMNGRTTLHDRWPANHKLTELEETVLLRHILDINSRGFAPRLAGVEDIANYLLKSWGEKCVGKL